MTTEDPAPHHPKPSPWPRRILVAAAILLTLLFALVLLLPVLTRFALARILDNAFQTDTSVGAISFEPTRHLLFIDDVTIANPPGFTDPNLLRADLAICFNPDALFNDEPAVEILGINNASISLERNALHQRNWLLARTPDEPGKPRERRSKDDRPEAPKDPPLPFRSALLRGSSIVLRDATAEEDEAWAVTATGDIHFPSSPSAGMVSFDDFRLAVEGPVAQPLLFEAQHASVTLNGPAPSHIKFINTHLDLEITDNGTPKHELVSDLAKRLFDPDEDDTTEDEQADGPRDASPFPRLGKRSRASGPADDPASLITPSILLIDHLTITLRDGPRASHTFEVQPVRITGHEPIQSLHLALASQGGQNPMLDVTLSGFAGNQSHKVFSLAVTYFPLHTLAWQEQPHLRPSTHPSLERAFVSGTLKAEWSDGTLSTQGDLSFEEVTLNPDRRGFLQRLRQNSDQDSINYYWAGYLSDLKNAGRIDTMRFQMLSDVSDTSFAGFLTQVFLAWNLQRFQVSTPPIEDLP